MNDYSKQALVWDWDAYDDTLEYDHWCRLASQYGKMVLVPMCAHGKSGAYMAEMGYMVTAFDISPEMISEGNKRFGSVENLSLLVADLTSLNLRSKDYDFAFISGNGDLNLLQPIETVEKALVSLSNHLRKGGCLVLEVSLPGKESWSSPKKVFHPRVPGYSDKRVWKENEVKYNAEEKRQYINQEVYIEDENGIESFTQDICLQYYEREELLALLQKCQFEIKGEYSNRNREPWQNVDSFLIIEAIRR